MPWASQVALVVKNLPANAGDRRDALLIPGSGRSPGGGHGHPLQYSPLGETHGQSSLAGYRPQGRKESDTTERLRMHSMHSLSRAFKGSVPRTELSLAIYEKNMGEVWWGKFGRA